MGEGFVGLLTAPWAPAAAAYLFGIATGWLLWGGRRAVRGEEAADPGTSDAAPAQKAPAAVKLGAVESEIRSARAMIEEQDAEAREIAAEISSLDDAVKRANGRLKLVLNAVRKAARR